MKKKLYGITAMVLTAAMLGGCGSSASSETTAAAAAAEETAAEESAGGEAAETEAAEEGGAAEVSGEELVIGTMANSLGLPVRQADLAGYFEDAGLNVSIEIFATGAPINEAMASGDLDVAVSGMASVYALATGMYTYVGDGVITTGGESIYARADSDIAKAAKSDRGVIGSAETVKDASILGPLATTAHYQAIKYAESFGLTADDFSMVSMDYAQAYQAFITGEGDLIATKMPYTNQLAEAGYVCVCDMNMVLDSPIVDTIFVQNDVAQNRAGDVQAFLNCYYRACEDLMNDEAMRRDVAMTWYAEEGITYSESDMDSEVDVKDYYTLDTINTDTKIGQFMVDIADFYVDQEMITAEELPNVAASIDDSFVEAAKTMGK